MEHNKGGGEGAGAKELLSLALTDGFRSLPSSSALHHLLMAEWEVEYSRFFSFPPRPRCPSGLKPLRASKSRGGGIWISASSLTLLRLRRPPSASVPVLSVSVPGLVYEEHFVSNLHISLPLLSCSSQTSGHGSRAILLSFRDDSNQIQKFALRFLRYCEVQTFLDNVKESSGDIIKIELRDFACESLISSVTVSPNAAMHHSIENSSYSRDEESTIGKPESALSFTDAMSQCSQPQSLCNITSISPGLPPSFTDLLTNCSANLLEGAEQPKPSFDDLNCNNQLRMLEQLANASLSEIVSALTQPMPEIPLNSEIVKYASSASFQDMIAKMECVIEELGSDMIL